MMRPSLLFSSPPKSEVSDVNVVQKENGFFDIRYAINDPGDYQMNVKFGGKDIPNGSFTVKVSVTIPSSLPIHVQLH